MSPFPDSRSLIEHAEGELPKIAAAYTAALTEKVVSARLLIEIKNFCENLRSSLDFAARGLFQRYCAETQKKVKIYFPYAVETQSRSDFEKSNRIEICIPGLRERRPDLVKLLHDMQHFGEKGYTWLPSFMDLTNENKHQRLVPQVRTEESELRISSGGAMMRVGENTRIVLGSNASIRIGGPGGAQIHGGQTFNARNPPRVTGGNVEIITWVSFAFESNGQKVIPFLETCLAGVRNIVLELDGQK